MEELRNEEVTNEEKILVNERVNGICKEVEKEVKKANQLYTEVQFYMNMISGTIQTDLSEEDKESFIVKLFDEMEGVILKYGERGEGNGEQA